VVHAITSCFMAIVNGIVTVIKAIINVSNSQWKRKPLLSTKRACLRTNLTQQPQGIVAFFSLLANCLTCGKAGGRRKTTSAV
jgi:hypothetical protein